MSSAQSIPERASLFESASAKPSPMIARTVASSSVKTIHFCHASPTRTVLQRTSVTCREGAKANSSRNSLSRALRLVGSEDPVQPQRKIGQRAAQRTNLELNILLRPALCSSGGAPLPQSANSADLRGPVAAVVSRPILSRTHL